jgi:hypothetical protein
VRAAAPLRAHLNDAVVPPRRLAHDVPLLNRVRERLSDVDVFPCLARQHHHPRMPVVWRADNHAIDRLVVEHASKVLRRIGRAILRLAKEVPDTQVVAYDYEDLLMTWELRSFARQNPVDGIPNGTSFHGTDASLVVDDKGWRVYARDGKEKPALEVMRGESESLAHARNFLECLKSRKQPNAPVEIGRLSTTLSHLGNISHRLRRDVRFDAKTETFSEDKAANSYLTKRYRKSYELPTVS